MDENEQKTTSRSLFQKIKEKEILYLGLVLFTICAVAGLCLGITYENTKGIIADKKEAVTKAAYQKVLPSSDDAEFIALDIDEAYSDDIAEAYEVDGVGYAIKVLGKGYAGDTIEIAVGITFDGTISGMTIISHSETPGLGAKATEAEFQGQFSGRPAEPVLKVIKSGDADIDEIDAISGATKTSNGVTAAVNRACSFYQDCLKKGVE
jgi:electron transport complex protein RnfG